MHLIDRSKRIFHNNVSIIRVGVLLGSFILSGWWAYRAVDRIRDKYQQTVIVSIEIGREDVALKNAAAELLKQSEQTQGWSILILGGLVAVLVTTKVHRAPNIEWAYLPLAPAAMFLINGVFAGRVLMRRYTYLVAKNNFDDLLSLSNLSAVQSDLFTYSLFSVGAFAGWFLLLIVLGKVEPFEVEKRK